MVAGETSPGKPQCVCVTHTHRFTPIRTHTTVLPAWWQGGKSPGKPQCASHTQTLTPKRNNPCKHMVADGTFPGKPRCPCPTQLGPGRQTLHAMVCLTWPARHSMRAAGVHDIFCMTSFASHRLHHIVCMTWPACNGMRAVGLCDMACMAFSVQHAQCAAARVVSSLISTSPNRHSFFRGQERGRFEVCMSRTNSGVILLQVHYHAPPSSLTHTQTHTHTNMCTHQAVAA